MTTLLDLTDDETTVMDLFLLLDRNGKDEAFRTLAINACYAVEARNADARGTKIDESPRKVAHRQLMRCANALPRNFSIDENLPREVNERFFAYLGESAIDLVLTTEDRIAGNAKRLADWADECAGELGWHRQEGEPDSDEEPPTYVDAEAMERFIREWRDSYFANLMRAAAQGR